RLLLPVGPDQKRQPIGHGRGGDNAEVTDAPRETSRLGRSRASCASSEMVLGLLHCWIGGVRPAPRWRAAVRAGEQWRRLPRLLCSWLGAFAGRWWSFRGRRRHGPLSGPAAWGGDRSSASCFRTGGRMARSCARKGQRAPEVRRVIGGGC